MSKLEVTTRIGVLILSLAGMFCWCSAMKNAVIKTKTAIQQPDTCNQDCSLNICNLSPGDLVTHKIGGWQGCVLDTQWAPFGSDGIIVTMVNNNNTVYYSHTDMLVAWKHRKATSK